MRSLRFLLSRRWVIFFVVVIVLAWVAWRLGEWQFHRLADRQERNAIIERNDALPPAPVADVLAVGDAVTDQEQWRVVEATGTYAPDDTVVVRYRTREGTSGVDLVVPLVLSDGTALLVDRGWVAAETRGSTPDDLPEPPPGEVRVTGWARQDATGDSTDVTDQSTRSISSDRIGAALDRPVLGGFVDLKSESPDAETPPLAAELPELDNGPHFFYGLQWWFFGLLAVFGFFYLMYDEWRGVRPKRRGTGDPEGNSERAEHPAVNREHHARQE